MLPVEPQGQQQQQQQQQISSREVRGVMIVSVPDGDGKNLGKNVFAAFTFQDQQQQHVTTNSPPQYAPVPTQAPEQGLPPPAPTPVLKKYVKRIRLILAILLFLGVIGFVLFRRSATGLIEEQWDDNEEWAHVHRLYAKRLISKAPENRTAGRDDIPEHGLFERDYSRRRLWERVVRSGSTVNASTSFDVHGNVYPDGYVNSLSPLFTRLIHSLLYLSKCGRIVCFGVHPQKKVSRRGFCRSDAKNCFPDLNNSSDTCKIMHVKPCEQYWSRFYSCFVVWNFAIVEKGC